MKIEIARKVSRDSSWVTNNFVVSENLFNWLVGNLIKIQNDHCRIYYTQCYSIKVSSLSKVFHFFLDKEGYDEAKRVLVEFVGRLRKEKR